MFLKKTHFRGFCCWLVHPDQLLTSGRRTEEKKRCEPGPAPAWFTEWSPPDLVNSQASPPLTATMAALQNFAFWFLVFSCWAQSEIYTVEEISNNSENQRLVGDYRSSWSNSNLHTHKYRDSDSEPRKLQRNSHFTRSRLKNNREGKCKLIVETVSAAKHSSLLVG